MDKVSKWIYDFLVENVSVSEHWASILDQFIVGVIIVILALLADYLVKTIAIGYLKRIAKKTKNDIDDILLEKKVFHRMAHLAPAIVIYYMIPMAILEYDSWVIIIQKAASMYMVFIVILVIFAFLDAMLHVYNRKEEAKMRPLNSIFQVTKVIIAFVAFIYVISVLANKSPGALFAGLGVFASVLLLVFKDSILGLVSGIQLSGNDMLRPGDWISMPKCGADGTVLEITLNTVKVENFDKTITTIPPYLLTTDAFQNWRGMEDSEGRRVKRSLNIDVNSVKFCDNAMLEKYKKIHLLTDYITEKEEELESYNMQNDINRSVIVNARKQTNIGVFRAYLECYLKSHPKVNSEMTLLVRQLQPGEKGLPIEVYFFSKIKEWGTYEQIQSDIFDHIIAVIPEFELRIFQTVSGADINSIKE